MIPDSVPDATEYEHPEGYDDFVATIVNDIEAEYNDQTQFLNDITEDSAWEKAKSDEDRLAEIAHESIEDAVLGEGVGVALFIITNTESDLTGWEPSISNLTPTETIEAMAHDALQNDVRSEIVRTPHLELPH